MEPPMNQHAQRLFLCWVLLLTPSDAAAGYDPLSLPKGAGVRTYDLTARDEARQRDIPLLVYLPEGTSAAPILLFSHGLGGTRKVCAFLAKHWSERGYGVVSLQHPGSDDSVWKDKSPGRRRAALKAAASAKNYLQRVRDVRAVLDQLDQWNQQAGHDLAGRLDLTRVGMSGHSFGAMTTQAVSGQTARFGGSRFTETRICAAIALSPSSPSRGDPATAFGSVKIPWMLMTGTKDVSPIGGQTAESRLAVYPHLPATIDKYELVLHNAEHSVFTDRALPGDREKRNPNHHRVILALSTAFWDAHLRQDAAARAWLQGTGPRSVLEPQDRWQLQRGRLPRSAGKR